MQPTTLRLSDELVAEIERLADEKGYSSRSEYIRVVLREHVEETDDVNDQATAIADLSERVRQLEERAIDRRDGSHDPRSGQQEGSISEGAESDESGPSVAREDQAHAVDHEDTDALRAATESDTSPLIEAALADWRPGRSAADRDERRQAGSAVLAWLREREVASASEFRESVEPDHPVTGQSAETWWRKTAREALKHAEEKALVRFIDGRKEWMWNGE